jgi:Xaa-Pro aminopeptidase
MEEFKNRRANLASQLQNNSVLLLHSAQLQIRNGDVEFPFRQDSNFYYLTGFAEPDSVMVLTKDAQGKITYTLFNRPNDPDAEVWNGKRVGQEGACKEYGADNAYNIEKIDSVLPELFANKQILYYPLGANKIVDQQVMTWIEVAKKNLNTKMRSENQTVFCVPDTLKDVLPLLYELRLFKSAQEVEFMRKAAEISALGHIEVMRAAKAGKFEYQLEAAFNNYCLDNGCRGLAYNSIVAAGNNACTLHYTSNDQAIKTGELILVDAGGEYNCYAADITRTFPVGGKFSEAQKQIYALVLKAQLAGIEQVKPGNTWDLVQEVMVHIIVAGLVDLGVMQGDIKSLIKDKEFKKFYMHGSGHWLGMDVHDVGNYRIDGKWRKFEPGMVLTVEPGIYIAQGLTKIDKKWLGIGVRIEDDILVTKNGNEVLSAKAPKEIDEIERATI